MTDEQTPNGKKEFRVLKAVKSVLTGVIKDTTVPPGHKHPLSDNTIEDIRQCLMLITSREQELLKEAGEDSNMKPHFTDETPGATVVPIDSISKKKKDD